MRWLIALMLCTSTALAQDSSVDLQKFIRDNTWGKCSRVMIDGEPWTVMFATKDKAQLMSDSMQFRTFDLNNPDELSRAQPFYPPDVCFKG
ncbi:hypothetical protein [Bradyrhizobium sp. USDA 4508]